MIGKTIGQYEVISALGAGGMGAVYRARDTKLGREVAVKILPEAFAKDAERLARFEREARTLASLNHPNIGQIYGVEGTALILELVEGDDLSTLIAGDRTPEAESGGSRPRDTNARQARGGGAPRGLNIDDVLSIAQQIALALECAHDAGVIHRDLKPANIKVRGDGTVKVLDFGLAKSMSADEASGGSGSSALTSPATTGLGVILGTASYMSPEQARGRRVDRRSDLWAFGVVIFEMLSGRQMFGGDTVTDVIAAVVTREPDWSALPSDTPPAIRRLLARCLQKDPARRIRDAADARLEIEEAQRDPHGAGESVPAGAGATSSRRRWPLLLGWAATTIAAAAIGAVAFGTRAGSDPPLRILNLSIPEVAVPSLALSPDGQWVAVVSTTILVKGMRESSWREVPGTTGAGNVLIWSPDSRSIAFAIDRSLRSVDLVGSRPKTICDRCMQPDSLRGGSWNKDDVLLLGGLGAGVTKIPVAGGAPERVTTLDTTRGENSHRYPTFLPDGHRFVFTVRRDNGEHELRVGDLGGGPTRFVASGFSKSFYADGYLLFARDETLLALPFDATAGQATGDPVKVADHVLQNVGTGFVAIGVGSDGTLVFGSAPQTRGYAFFDRRGRKLSDVTTRTADAGGRLDRSGRRAVIAEMDPEKANTDIYITDIATGARSRLTSEPRWEQRPVWSPDGERVAYRVGSEVYVQTIAGGKPVRLVDSRDGVSSFVHDWSPDGKYLLVTRSSMTGAELVRVSLSDGQAESIAPSLAGEASEARLSPDGHWVAYQSTETGSREIHIRSFPDGRVFRRVTATGGDTPLWSRDGSELFYLDGEGWVVACKIRVNGAKIEFGAVERLFKPNLANTWATGYQHDVDAEGRFFVYRVGDETGSFARTLTVMLNWTKLINR